MNTKNKLFETEKNQDDALVTLDLPTSTKVGGLFTKEKLAVAWMKCKAGFDIVRKCGIDFKFRFDEGRKVGTDSVKIEGCEVVAQDLLRLARREASVGLFLDEAITSFQAGWIQEAGIEMYFKGIQIDQDDVRKLLGMVMFGNPFNPNNESVKMTVRLLGFEPIAVTSADEIKDIDDGITKHDSAEQQDDATTPEQVEQQMVIMMQEHVHENLVDESLILQPDATINQQTNNSTVSINELTTQYADIDINRSIGCYTNDQYDFNMNMMNTQNNSYFDQSTCYNTSFNHGVVTYNYAYGNDYLQTVRSDESQIVEMSTSVLQDGTDESKQLFSFGFEHPFLSMNINNLSQDDNNMMTRQLTFPNLLCAYGTSFDDGIISTLYEVIDVG